MSATDNLIPMEALERPLAYHPVFRRVSKSTVAAVMLSQAWCWTNTLPDTCDGWFCKTMAEWEEETGLSRSEQETARRALAKIGVLEVERKGVPARLWFRIHVARLDELIRAAYRSDEAYRVLDETIGITEVMEVAR